MKHQDSRAEVVRSAFKASSLFWTAFAGVALAFVSTLAYGHPSEIERIETTNALLSLKAGSGDLVGLEWKHPRLEFIAEPRLGENFRILLPRPDYEANYFNSRDQVVRKIDKSASGVVLHYGPIKNEREEVNVDVTYEVRDTGSQIEFSIKVDNHTDLPLAEVFYAVIGGQQGIGNRVDTRTHLPGNDLSNLAPSLFTIFPNYSEENIGSRFDSVSFVYPDQMPMGWIDVYNPKIGLGYFYANEDTEPRYTRLYAQRTPSGKATTLADNWPDASSLPPDEPLGLTLGWINFPYTKQGSFQAGPIVLKVHPGDWREAARLHRAWFDQHYSLRKPSWTSQQMAWQMVLLGGSQGNVRFRFADLPKLAAEAKQYGVTGMQLFGWSVGGLERGYPEYKPDPRLGTREEFRQALAQMRQIGMHSLLELNIAADTSTEDFRTRWSKYAVQARFAPDWRVSGWSQDTLGGRSNQLGTPLNHAFTGVNLSHPEIRKYIVDQFVELMRDGVESIQFDGGIGGGLDFNLRAPGFPDKSATDGALAFLADIRTRAQQVNPQFAMTSFTPCTAVLPYIDVCHLCGYVDNKDVGSTAFFYAFPEMTRMLGSDRPWDFDRLNNGLRYGMVWVLGPRQYTASMDEEMSRPLSRYLRELIRIRGQFADVLFHGRFSEALGANDPPGATVTGDKENIRYSMFQPMDPKNPARAAVVVNFGDRDESVDVSMDGKKGQNVKISAPFQPDRVAELPVKLTLPPHRAAVVVAEQ